MEKYWPMNRKPIISRRLRVVAIVGVVLVGATAAYISLFLARPIGSGPSGPAVAAEPFETVWTERPVMLIGIGDSITAGLGARSPSHSYVSRLLENPADEFPDMQGKNLRRVLPNLQSKNIAVSGSTSLQHVDMIAGRLESMPQDVYGIVVMTSGGNDIIHSYGRMPPKEGAMYGATLSEAQPWIANFEQRLIGMLDTIIGLFPGGCEIYLADIYDPTDGVGDAPSVFLPHWPDGLAIHTAYNEVIRRVASQKPQVHFVPLHQTFLGHGSHCRQFWREYYDKNDPHYWYFENVEDPNDRGYDAIRRLFLNSIIENTSLRNHYLRAD